MRIIAGDLLDLALKGEFDVIVHGCDCQCLMGKGIALSIKRQFPAAYEADLRTARGSRSKLGTYSSAKVVINGKALTIVNAYTQFHWTGSGVRADYDAIRRVMRTIAHDFAKLRIGYPKIGAGLAGGDWSVISAILDTELDGMDHTYVQFVG